MAAFCRPNIFLHLFKSALSVPKRMTLVKCSMASTSLVLGMFMGKQSYSRTLCEGEKLQPPDPSKLSHSYLIRNAASQTINSALTLLNQTIVALEETEKVYTLALERLKMLLDYNMTVLGDPLRADHTWTEIIKIKGDIVTLKQQKEELQFVYENAEKTVYAAAETAFCSGVVQMSIVANERLFAAKLTKETISRKSSQLEKEILKIEVDTIERTMQAQKQRQQNESSENENEILENVEEEENNNGQDTS